ncbi:cardiolipin synthase [Longirhabdus pacifica]|uniref:cardiolipin synthase n=1 Tax=Longirhabdus pacifica TaxID=2305227 RepID=UPI001008E416|nr:cardiolipin synthase [Longirhabdus pacifica]
MKKIVRLLFSRFFIISTIIVAQIAFLSVIISGILQYSSLIYSLVQLAAIVMVIIIIGNNNNPSYKLAWSIVILIFPLLGVAFYLTSVHTPSSVRFKQKMKKYLKYHTKLLDHHEHIYEEVPHIDQQYIKTSKFIKNAVGYPIWKNTNSTYFSTGEAFFAEHTAQLKKAKKFIFLEYFIIEEGVMWNTTLEILKEKAAEGVKVYLLYDDLGTINTLPARYDKTLREAGIHVEVFNPFKPKIDLLMNQRDHRKITVIDGKVGFCGGLNLADEYINVIEKYGHWKDTAVMIEGEAVSSLISMFLQLWNYTSKNDLAPQQFLNEVSGVKSDGFVQPFADIPKHTWDVSENTYLNIINRATKYVYITTPYLIIDHNMMTSLIRAAKSGVDVRIITPHIPDKKIVFMTTQSYYRALVANGIKIYEYTPGFIHAKMIVADDTISVVGTINMDYRSLYLHFECGILFMHSNVISAVKEDILETMKKCEEMNMDKLKKTPFYTKAIHIVLRLFAPLM